MAIYFGVGVKKVYSEFINDGHISDGPQTFAGVALGSNGFEGEMQDISILPSRAKQMGEPLTESEQSEMRS